MKITPSRDEIGASLGKDSRGTIAYTQLVADLETPVSAMMKLGAERPYSCLLESVEGGNQRGRFSVIAINPDLIWSCDQDKAWLAHPDGTPIGDSDSDIFGSLRQIIEDFKTGYP